MQSMEGKQMDGPRVLPTADVDDRAVLGAGTVVWHLAQIRENARLGQDCIVDLVAGVPARRIGWLGRSGPVPRLHAGTDEQ